MTVSKEDNIREIESKRFFSSIQSTNNSFPVIMADLIKKSIKKRRAFSDYVKKHGKTTKKIIAIKYPYAIKAEELKKEYDQYSYAVTSVPSSVFVSIISNYESFISNFLKSIIAERYDYLKSQQKSIDYEQILSFTSLNELKSMILDKEIFSFTSESSFNQLKWIEKKFGVEIINKISDINLFVECCLRRNLYVHSGGKCTKSYREFCQEKDIKMEKEYKDGDQISLTGEYFSKSCGIILEVAVIVSQELWRKLRPDEKEVADELLNDFICFELLKNKEYELANKVLDYPIKYINKYSSDFPKYALVINKAIACKFSGKKEEAEKILEQYDWSILKHEYEMAYHVLKDDVDQAIILMLLMGEKFPPVYYSKWPLFDKFKKEKKFKETYKKIYHKEFSELYK